MKNNNKVSYSYCSGYNPDEAQRAVDNIINENQDLTDILKSKKGLKVLIKPNLLAARHPDKAITTHPVVLQALINHLQQYECSITIGDSPAGPYNKNVLDKLYQTCQLSDLENQENVRLNYDLTDEVAEYPQGISIKKFLVIKPAMEADLIINFAKMKTHTLTRLTCGVKNLFGLMPGVVKFRQHIAMPDIRIFSNMLVDINGFLEGKVFTLVDGIVGMEGEGPSNGDPKFAGALFGGWNAQAVDVLACHIIGMPIETVSTILDYKSIEDIELKEFDDLKTYQFELPPVRNRSIPDKYPMWLQAFLANMIVAKPVIDKKVCKGCNICVEACPAEIIELQTKKAVILSYPKCIKCYCCQESCPYGAIKLSKPPVEKFFMLIRKFKGK